VVTAVDPECSDTISQAPRSAFRVLRVQRQRVWPPPKEILLKINLSKELFVSRMHNEILTSQLLSLNLWLGNKVTLATTQTKRAAQVFPAPKIGSVSGMKRILEVLRIERGAITADWVAVMCGLAGLGLFLISAIDQHLTTFAAADYAVISLSQR